MHYWEQPLGGTDKANRNGARGKASAVLHLLLLPRVANASNVFKDEFFLKRQ